MQNFGFVLSLFVLPLLVDIALEVDALYGTRATWAKITERTKGSVQKSFFRK